MREVATQKARLTGWVNPFGQAVDSLQKYPNHFSPSGMDMFALPNEQVERRDFNSLIGVGGKDLEAVRKVAQSWHELGDGRVTNLDCVSRLHSTAGANNLYRVP
ncbi:MAG: hypothetical protein ABIP71_00265 [Verrucomicrobiota bacterium]